MNSQGLSENFLVTLEERRIFPRMHHDKVVPAIRQGVVVGEQPREREPPLGGLLAQAVGEGQYHKENGQHHQVFLAPRPR